MTHTNISKKIEEIILSVGLDPTENLFDQMDSMSFITIIVEIEQAFGIEVPDERLDFTVLNTVDDFAELVMNLCEKIDSI